MMSHADKASVRAERDKEEEGACLQEIRENNIPKEKQVLFFKELVYLSSRITEL